DRWVLRRFRAVSITGTFWSHGTPVTPHLRCREARGRAGLWRDVGRGSGVSAVDRPRLHIMPRVPPLWIPVAVGIGEEGPVQLGGSGALCWYQFHPRPLVFFVRTKNEGPVRCGRPAQADEAEDRRVRVRRSGRPTLCAGAVGRFRE